MLGLQPRPVDGRGRRLAASTRSRCCDLRAVAAGLRLRRDRASQAAPPPGARHDRAHSRFVAATLRRGGACAGRMRRRRRVRRRPASRSVDVKLTDAGCEPAELRLAAGPTTFEVANDGADEGHRVRDPRRRPHPRREREHRAGPLGALLADPEARPLHAVLPRRHERRARPAGRHRRRPPRRERGARPTRRSPATARYVEAQTTLLGARTRRFVAAAARPATSRRRKALYADGPRPVRADRAGGRELRRPRPGDRRPRRRRPEGEVDRLPPDRAGPLGATARPAGWTLADKLLADVDDARSAA